MTVKSLMQYRKKVLDLLEKRSKFVDARSYNSFKDSIFTFQKKKLDDLYLTLKKIKKIPDATLTKKNFKSMLAKAEAIQDQVYQVTIYGNYKIQHKNWAKGRVEHKQEALDTFEFKGNNEKKLKKEIRRREKTLYENHYETDNYYDNNIRRLESFHWEKSPIAKMNIPINKIPMKNAYVLHRDWLKYAEGIDKKSYENMNGQCVYELLSNHLSNPAKRINMTKEKLFEIFNSYYQTQEGFSDLDYGLNTNVFEGAFNMNSGVTPDMIKHLCQSRKISMYAFDAKQNCFDKLTFPSNSNYRPIAYYAIDGHMYLITDPKIIRSLSESQKTEKRVMVSSLLEMDTDEPMKCTENVDELIKQTKSEIKNLPNTKENKERLEALKSSLQTLLLAKMAKREHTQAKSFDEALKMENAIVYVPTAQITDEVYQYIAQTKSIPKIKTQGHAIVRMDIKDKLLSIVCDPNLTDGYTWKEIQDVCQNAEIDFNNQTIGGLIYNLKDKYQKSLTPDRRSLTDKEKSALIQKQESHCALCQIKTNEFEFDHIVPLAAGGSNDDENFQALCKSCHAHKCSIERESGDYIKYDDWSSSFNDEALKIIQSHHAKHWAFIDKLKIKAIKKKVAKKCNCLKKRNYTTLKFDDRIWTAKIPKAKSEENLTCNCKKSIKTTAVAEEHSEIYKIDHAKCRRNLVMHSQFDFPKFSVMDYPTEYDGSEIKCGYYFVETKNYFPFRGNGWYNYVLVQYGLDNKIDMKITHQFIPSYTIEKNHFKNFAEYLIKNSDNVIGADQKPFSKKIVNSMVGCWNIHNTKYEQIGFTLDKYEAAKELCREGVMVTSTDIAGTTLYQVIESRVIAKDDVCIPLYDQVLAMEAVELHKLYNFIKKHGGQPLELNTDAILYRGPQIDIAGHFYDKECTVPKYRYDEPTRLKVDNVCRMVRSGNADVKLFEFDKIKADDREFEDIANDVIASNKGCLVTGIAGTGKTYFANLLISKLEKQGKVVGVKLAPTNKAASHIKGQTIHKYFMSLMLSQNYEKKLLKNLNNFDYIVVDEISMVKEVFYRFFTIIRRYVPKVKFIVIGDFAQFKPVQDSYVGSYENSPALHLLCDGQRVNLTKCRRSDPELFNLYSSVENIKSIDLSLFEYKELTPLNIAYTHKTRKAVNRECMKKFVGEKDYLTCEASSFNKKTQKVKIFEGMPIVAYRNLSKEGIFNSEVFTVTSIDMDEETFSFMVGEDVMTYKANQFKNLFYPAFCITAHVSQGCTFDQPYTIWDWKHPRMDHTAKYVALSRATNIKNIQIKI